MENYKISQSTLGDFEDSYNCRRKWFYKNVKKEIPKDPPSNQMVKGIVFETLALGENVSGEDMPDHDFLYNKTGKKSVELERIEEQALKYKRMVDPSSEDYIGIKQEKTQLYLENEFTKGVLDIVCEDEFESKVVADLKFTADVENDRGDFSWGREPDKIDWKQLAIYKRLFEDNFESPRSPKTYNIVFDASPRMGIKLFDVKLSDSYIDNVIERARIGAEYVDMVNQGDIDIDMKVNPSKANCDSCPLDCDFRFKEQIVNKIKVYV